MARIYANENLYRPTVAKLRDLGHDVLTSFEAGNANLSQQLLRVYRPNPK